MLKRAMLLVKPITIQNCFRKEKLVAQASQADFAKDKDIEEEMGLAGEEFLGFVTFDDDLLTSGGIIDLEICENVIAVDDENQDKDKFEDVRD